MIAQEYRPKERSCSHRSACCSRIATPRSEGHALPIYSPFVRALCATGQLELSATQKGHTVTVLGVRNTRLRHTSRTHLRKRCCLREPANSLLGLPSIYPTTLLPHSICQQLNRLAVSFAAIEADSVSIAVIDQFEMSLEATVVCVDNSEWTRNGDYAPNRFQAQADAVNLLAGAKTQANPENTVSILVSSAVSPAIGTVAHMTPEAKPFQSSPRGTCCHCKELVQYAHVSCCGVW